MNANIRFPALDLRPEFEREPIDASAIGSAEMPLSPVQRLINHAAFRRGMILLGLALLWQGYALWLDNPLLFPTFTETVGVLVRDFVHGELLDRVTTSMRVLLIGYAFGVGIAAVLTTLAGSSRLGAIF